VIMGSTKRLLISLSSDAAFYGILSGLSKLASLIIVPIVMRSMSIEEFGRYDKLLVLFGLLSTIAVLGQDSAIATYYFKVENTNKRGEILLSSLFLQGLALTIMFFVYALVNWNAPLDIFIFLVFCVGFVLHNFSRNIFKWIFDKAMFATVSIGQIIFVLCLVLYFSYDKSISSTRLLLVIGVSYLLFGGLGFLMLRKRVGSRIDFRIIRKLLYVGIPLGLVSITGVASKYLERESVLALSDAYTLGIYSASLKVILPISLINLALGTSWAPLFFSLTNDINRSRKYEIVYLLIATIIIVMQLLLFVFGERLLLLLSGSQYVYEWKILALIITTAVYDILSGHLQLGAVISEKSLGILIAYGISLGIAMLMILFIPGHDEYTVAFAFLVSSVIRALWIRDLSNRSGSMSQSLTVTIIPLVILGYAWFFV